VGKEMTMPRPRVVLANAFSLSMLSATETLRGEIITLEVIAKVYVVAILAVISISFILGILQKTDLELLLIIMSVAVGAVSAFTLAIVALKGLIPLRR
jgi:hypothetical protein